MKVSKEMVVIDDVKYVRADCVSQNAKQLEGMDYCIIRTYSAGVFVGYVESRNEKEVVIRKSRGIWYWDGSAGLSELAVKGTSKPEKCKFTVEVDRRELTEVIEIIPCTEAAKRSIASVKEWTAH